MTYTNKFSSYRGEVFKVTHINKVTGRVMGNFFRGPTQTLNPSNLTPQEHNEEKFMSTNKSWEFNISRLAQIDYDKIAEDLSWENPLALLTVGDSLEAVVFGPLYRKALEIRVTDYPGVAMRTKKGYISLSLFAGSNIEPLKKWAANVRQAPWQDAYKATVKVSLLSV